MSNNTKLILEDIKLRLKEINPNIEILSDEYINNQSKLMCKCLIDGHEWGVKWSHLKCGHGCPKCSNRNSGSSQRLNMFDIKIRLAQLNNNIIILDDVYTNNHTKLNCKCLLCSNDWKSTWNNLLSGKGCPKCAKSNLDGAYSIINAEKKKEIWSKTDAIVYIIKCFNDDEEFYKIGVTKSTVKSRFKSKLKMPYKYKIIHEIKTNLYDAVYIERQLHENNSEFCYTPNIKFGGHLECFYDLKFEKGWEYG